MTWRPRICPRQDAGSLKNGAFFPLHSSLPPISLHSLFLPRIELFMGSHFPQAFVRTFASGTVLGPEDPKMVKTESWLLRSQWWRQKVD